MIRQAMPADTASLSMQEGTILHSVTDGAVLFVLVKQIGCDAGMRHVPR